jgi:hypothetical protein
VAGRIPLNLVPLRLAAVTAHPRHTLVAQLSEALNGLGSVLDSHPFSTLALAIQFEVSPRLVAQLKPTLLALPLAFSDASLAALTALDQASATDLPPEITGSLNVTFVHTEPDLHQHIPAVPG